MITEITDFFRQINYTPSTEELRDSLAFFSKEREDVRSLIEELSWNATETEQQMAINALADKLQPCEYIYLVLPDKYFMIDIGEQAGYYKAGTDKSRWENAAKTIIKIGWPKADAIIVPLFIWLLDPNWPGSNMIYDFLCSLPKDVVAQNMKRILGSPESYSLSDYNDLKEQIQDMCQDLGIHILQQWDEPRD